MSIEASDLSLEQLNAFKLYEKLINTSLKIAKNSSIIPQESIISLDEIHKPNKSDKRNNLQKYDCDWKIMYSQLLKLINDINNKDKR